MNIPDLVRVFTAPSGLFAEVAEKQPSAGAVFLRYALWVGLLPPLCAFFGMTLFGWRFGVGEAVRLDSETIAAVAVTYYVALLGGYGAATFLSRWMAPTYGAGTAAGLHAALVAIVGTPLMAGGALHLYPLLPFNLLCLIPAILWSAWLLYTGIPVLFGIDVNRGMLMASAILGVFFVAVAALAAFTMVLWTHGLGPDIGFNWRASVAG